MNFDHNYKYIVSFDFRILLNSSVPSQGLNPGQAIGELKKMVSGVQRKDEPDLVPDS